MFVPTRQWPPPVTLLLQKVRAVLRAEGALICSPLVSSHQRPLPWGWRGGRRRGIGNTGFGASQGVPPGVRPVEQVLCALLGRGPGLNVGRGVTAGWSSLGTGQELTMAFESLGFDGWRCFEGLHSLTAPVKVGAVEGRIVLVEILEVLPNPRMKRRDRNHARVEEPQLGR